MDKPLQAVFAAQANNTIGAGHVARCSELAKHFINDGYQVYLFGVCDIFWLSKEITSVFENALESHRDYIDECDVLIIDSYSKDFIEDATESIRAREIIFLADLDTPVKTGSVICWLDPFEPPKTLIRGCKVIAKGPRFLSTREYCEFDKLPSIASQVLVVTGGTERETALSTIMEVVESLELFNTKFHFVSERVLSLTRQRDISFYPFGNNVHTLANVCDTVISAAGSMVWDFIAARRCLAVFSLVPNQFSNYSYITKEGLAIGLQRKAETTFLEHDYLRENLCKLFFDSATRGSIIEAQNQSGLSSGLYELKCAITYHLRNSEV
jgi:spore coat polysaccharide biosynthesis predicted glycosyltransferase SpsG